MSADAVRGAPSRARPRPPSRPNTYHHGDLRNALVRVALVRIEADGAETFSLREAATSCGVAVSAAYKHFASKGELLDAVADIGFAALAAAMQAGADAAEVGRTGVDRAEARLVAIGRAYILFAVERPALFRLMYGPLGPRGGRNDPRPDAPAHRLSALLRDALADVLHAYGTARADLDASKMVAWALVHGFAMMVVDGVWAEPGREALDATIELLGRATLRALR